MATGKIEQVFGYDNAYIKFPNKMAFTYGNRNISVPASGTNSINIELPITFESAPSVLATAHTSQPTKRSVGTWNVNLNTIALYVENTTTTALSFDVSWFVVGRLAS